jgi:murein L,D-transpeptidase YcbB/YkuD
VRPFVPSSIVRSRSLKNMAPKRSTAMPAVIKALKKSPKASPKSAAAVKKSGTTATSSSSKAHDTTTAQKAQKKIAGSVAYAVKKGNEAAASAQDIEKAAAANNILEVYKKCKDKTKFAADFERHGIDPKNLRWMISYTKTDEEGTVESNDTVCNMFTR